MHYAALHSSCTRLTAATGCGVASRTAGNQHLGLLIPGNKHGCAFHLHTKLTNLLPAILAAGHSTAATATICGVEGAVVVTL